MAKKKAKPITPAPTTTDEANQSLAKIGELQGKIDVIEIEFAETISRLRRETDIQLDPLKQQLEDLMLGLEFFATGNRVALLETVGGRRKTVQLTAGVFGWRLTSAKVATGKMSDIALIEKLKALGLAEQYVRLREEVDKEALLRDRPVIPGVTYSQKELFFIEPKSEISSTRTVP